MTRQTKYKSIVLNTHDEADCRCPICYFLTLTDKELSELNNDLVMTLLRTIEALDSKLADREEFNKGLVAALIERNKVHTHSVTPSPYHSLF